MEKKSMTDTIIGPVQNPNIVYWILRKAKQLGKFTTIDMQVALGISTKTSNGVKMAGCVSHILNRLASKAKQYLAKNPKQGINDPNIYSITERGLKKLARHKLLERKS